jgi:hypothetical protein
MRGMNQGSASKRLVGVPWAVSSMIATKDRSPAAVRVGSPTATVLPAPTTSSRPVQLSQSPGVAWTARKMPNLPSTELVALKYSHQMPLSGSFQRWGCCSSPAVSMEATSTGVLQLAPSSALVAYQMS